MERKSKNKININELIIKRKINYIASESNFQDSTTAVSTTCNLTDAFNHFIAEKKRQGLRPRTIKEHEIHIRYFKSYLFKYKPAIKSVRDIKSDDINDYISYMIDKDVWDDHPSLHKVGKGKLQPTTVNTRLRTLKCLLKHWSKVNLLKEDLAVKITLMKTDTNIKAFSQEEVDRLVAQFDSIFTISKYSELRNLVIIQLLVDTGARIEQLLSIETQSVSLIHKEIELSSETSKGRRQHTIHFRPKTAQSIQILIELNKHLGFNSKYLFLSKEGTKYNANSFRKALKKYSQKGDIAGVRVSPHTFRHFFALTFIKNGGDISTLSKLLDHKDISTTSRYLIADKKQIKNAYEKFSPNVNAN